MILQVETHFPLECRVIHPPCSFGCARDPAVSWRVQLLTNTSPESMRQKSRHSSPSNVGGWFTKATWNMFVKMGSSSPNRGENSKKKIEVSPPSKGFLKSELKNSWNHTGWLVSFSISCENFNGFHPHATKSCMPLFCRNLSKRIIRESRQEGLPLPTNSDEVTNELTNYSTDSLTNERTKTYFPRN